MLEIMIEIGMEQTRLCQCTVFHYAEKSANFNHYFNHEFSQDFKSSGTPL